MKQGPPIDGRVPLEPGDCPPKTRTADPERRRARALEKQLENVLGEQRVRVSRSKVTRFAVRLGKCESLARLSKLDLRRTKPITDILFWIRKADAQGNSGEVLWRTFLAGHFGRSTALTPDAEQSAGKLLCAFGSAPCWTWKRVSSSPDILRQWLNERRDQVKSLRFGNHRKYESHKPPILYRVVSSFLEWVKDNGGTPSSAFKTMIDGAAEASFDSLYHSLRHVFRFGRTGTFDLLCLLGDLDILPVRPGSCYLIGSTGPLMGARKLWGRKKPQELNRLADSTARALKVPFDVFEDALCMWQK